MPGRHVTDHQMRLYMKFRQTDTPAVAAAKASISTATAYRIEQDPAAALAEEARRANGAGPIRWPTFSTPRSCRCCRPRPAFGRSPSSRRCCGAIPSWAPAFAGRWSGASAPGARSTARSRR